jgi:hypothetical protein
MKLPDHPMKVLNNDLVMAAVMAADPEIENSLRDELDKRGVTGPDRLTIEGLWYGTMVRKGHIVRPRYVHGFTPVTLNQG